MDWDGGVAAEELCKKRACAARILLRSVVFRERPGAACITLLPCVQ